MSATGGEEPTNQPPEEPHQRQTNAREPFWDFKASHWVEIALTAALVFVGVSQLGVYKKQASVMQRQTSILQDQADISRGQVELSQATEAASVNYGGIRFVHSAIPDPVHGDYWNILYELDNDGPTEASHILTFSVCFGTDKPINPITNDRLPPPSVAPVGTPSIGAQKSINLDGCAIEQTTISRVTANELHLYLLGEFSYRTIFSGNQTPAIVFCFEIIDLAETGTLESPVLTSNTIPCGTEKYQNAQQQ